MNINLALDKRPMSVAPLEKRQGLLEDISRSPRNPKFNLGDLMLDNPRLDRQLMTPPVLSDPDEPSNCGINGHINSSPVNLNGKFTFHGGVNNNERQPFFQLAMDAKKVGKSKKNQPFIPQGAVAYPMYYANGQIPYPMFQYQQIGRPVYALYPQPMNALLNDTKQKVQPFKQSQSTQQLKNLQMPQQSQNVQFSQQIAAAAQLVKPLQGNKETQASKKANILAKSQSQPLSLESPKKARVICEITSNNINQNVNDIIQKNNEALDIQIPMKIEKPPSVQPLHVEPLDVPLKPPEPKYIVNQMGKFGLRCVCKNKENDEVLIQCSKCHFWLHAMCINVPRQCNYICPFCTNQTIRCKCEKNMEYDKPLIQCEICHKWSHKECENLDFGINPEHFICTKCGGNNYSLPDIKFDDEDYKEIPDITVSLDESIDKLQIIQKLKEGKFKEMIESDLNSSELSLRPTLEKYFKMFAPYLFDRSHEFWQTFISTLSKIFNCEGNILMKAMDLLAIHLLYQPNIPKNSDGPFDNSFSHSEAITEYLNSMKLPKLDQKPKSIQLYCGETSGVYTPEDLEEFQFIADIPGFLMHTDEVRAENGIPRNCLLVTDRDLVISTEGTSFEFASKIKRSFHFNTIIKLYRLNGHVRAGLYATKMKGPLSEERHQGRNRLPILANSEIILPMDGQIPFPVKKVEWKERKVPAKKAQPQTQNKSNKSKSEMTTRSQDRKKKTKNEKPQNIYPELTLLSSFYDDFIPPMPFIVLDDQETVDKYIAKQEKQLKYKNIIRK